MVTYEHVLPFSRAKCHLPLIRSIVQQLSWWKSLWCHGFKLRMSKFGFFIAVQNTVNYSIYNNYLRPHRWQRAASIIMFFFLQLGFPFQIFTILTDLFRMKVDYFKAKLSLSKLGCAFTSMSLHDVMSKEKCIDSP